MYHIFFEQKKSTVVLEIGESMDHAVSLAVGGQKSDLEDVIIHHQRMGEATALDFPMRWQLATNRTVQVWRCYYLSFR